MRKVNSSHSENVASARRVRHEKQTPRYVTFKECLLETSFVGYIQVSESLSHIRKPSTCVGVILGASDPW